MNFGFRYTFALIIGGCITLLWLLVFTSLPLFELSVIPPGETAQNKEFYSFIVFLNSSYIAAWSPFFLIICFFSDEIIERITEFKVIYFLKSRFSIADPNYPLDWGSMISGIPSSILGLFKLFFGFITFFLIVLPFAYWHFGRLSTFWLVWRLLVTLIIPTFLLTFPAIYVALKEELGTHPRFRSWFKSGRGGSSRWAGIRNYRKHRCTVFDEDISASSVGFENEGIYLGKTLFEDTVIPEHISIKDDGHLLTIGCTGSGKSTTSLWTNMSLYKGSMFIIDPKGEHARKTFWRRTWTDNFPEGKKPKTTEFHLFRGQSFILDPFSQTPELPSSRYNPLADIDINSDRVRAMLTAISDACVLSEGSKNQHFVEMASLLLEGVIAHVLSTYPEENHNLPYVCDLLIGFDPEISVADPDRFNNLLYNMRENGVAGKIAQLAASKILEMGDNERGSVLSTLTRSIKWITDPAMRKHLETSDFSMDIIKDRHHGNNVYVVLPFDLMKEQVRWMRTITNIAIGIIQNAVDRPLNPVVFVLDEFPMMGGKLKKIEEGIVTLRSAGVKLWIIIQNIGQLKRDYDKNWETFVSSSTVQLFGVKDLETSQWASEMLGKNVYQRKEKAGRFSKRVVQEDLRDIATPEEVREVLGKSRPFQYVFPMEDLPMRLSRLAYKPMEVEGNYFKGLPLDGHFEE